MVSQEVTIKNRAGIHARPAALLVQRANEYSSQILIKKGDNQINAKSIMGILALGASYNSVLELIVEGEDEIQALEGLVALFNNRFEEE
jgi:phosphocarrier protein